MISHTAIICMFHKLSSLITSQPLFFLDFLNTSFNTTLQEHRHQVFTLSKDVVTTSSDDDAILLSNHIR